MRVLIVHNFYQHAGGEDSIVLGELATLEQRGVDVELFSVDNHEISGACRTLRTAAETIYSFSARQALRNKIREFSPDVVHIHNFFPLLSPSVLDACRDCGVPSVMTLHSFRILMPGGVLYPDAHGRERNLRDSCFWSVPKRVYRNSAAATLVAASMVEFHKWTGTWSRKVDCFIALTDWAKQKFIEGGLPAEKIVVKPNFTAGPEISEGVEREGALFVGLLNAQKGIEVALQAWSTVDYPLRIIGDGPLAEFVERSANGRVVCLGRQPREVVQREMQAAKFLLLPSMGNEMFPVTLLEAYSNRLPVICSDLPCLEALLEPGVTGMKFASGDPAALRAQVLWAISNPSALDEMGNRARAAYEERYTPRSNFDQLIQIYESLCRARRAGSKRCALDTAPRIA